MAQQLENIQDAASMKVRHIKAAPKPSLKIRTANAICWIYLGVFRDNGLDNIFFRNKTFFVFQDRKLKLLASV